MSKSIWTLLAVAVALVAAFFLLPSDDGATSRDLSSPTPNEVEAATDRARTDLAPVEEAERASTPRVPAEARTASDAPAAAEALSASSDDDRPRVRGRVLDLRGVGLAGFEVRERGTDPEMSADAAGAQEPEELLATSDATGTFEFPIDLDASLMLTAERADWVTLRHAKITRFTIDRDHVLVVAPAVSVAGRIVDETGAPVPGAEVYVHFGDERYAEFPRALDLTARRSFRSRADERGRFALANIPSAKGAELTARAPGHEAERRAVPTVSDSNLVIELTRQDEEDFEEPVVTGTVLLPDFSPAAGATVGFASAMGQADEAGGFELRVGDMQDYDDGMPLVAALEGYGAAVQPEYGATVRARMELLSNGGRAMGSIDDVVLVLGKEPYELTGRVMREDGTPLPGWHVALVDPTEMSRGMVPAIHAENLGGDRFGGTAQTDAEGRFEVTQLLLRPYRLKAWSPESLLQVTTEPILAGTQGVEIVVPDDAVRERVVGRIESLRGEPIAGASVSVSLVLQRSGGATYFTTRDAVVTDANGRFEMEDVPYQHVMIDVGGDLVVPTKHEVPGREVEGELVLAVPRRCHFRVEASGLPTDEQIVITALDHEGEGLSIMSFTASGSMASRMKRLDAEGKMPVCTVSETAATIVLNRTTSDGLQELARREIALDPDQVTEIHFDL